MAANQGMVEAVSEGVDNGMAVKMRLPLGKLPNDARDVPGSTTREASEAWAPTSIAGSGCLTRTNGDVVARAGN